MRKRLTCICLFIISLFVINISTSFADEIKLVTSVDKNVLTTKDSINLTIMVIGSTSTEQPKLPDLKGFNLIFGPSVSSRTSIVNGEVSVRKGFTYMLKPKSAGKFTIDPFTLDHKGKTYVSNKIDINILDKSQSERLKNSDGSFNIDEKVFVEFETDKKEAYVYEQVILTFRFFYQSGLPITDLEYSEPDTRNFLKESMGGQEQYEVIRNGVIYNVIQLKAAIFPVVSGELKISPAKVQCSLLVKSKRRRRRRNPLGDSFFDDFFGGTQKRYPVVRETETIVLPVKPLPEDGKPTDFKGAVGVYSVDIEVDPKEVNVGDPVTLTMTVQGKGNIQTISEPIVELLNDDDFRVYPPESNTTITSKNKDIKGMKVFRTVIEPQNTDITETPLISFSFFDPEVGEYKTLIHDSIPIKVNAGEVESPIRLYVRESETEKDHVSIIGRDILPIMNNLTAFSNNGLSLHRKSIFFILIFIPLVAVIASIFLQKFRKRLKTDVSFVRKRRALADARKRLSEIKRDLGKIAAEDGYTRISNTMADYIADKLNITSASVMHIKISNIPEIKKLPKETIDKLVELMDICDYGRFAKGSGSNEMILDAINSTEWLINTLEKQM